MADRVAPIIRLMFVCDEAMLDPDDDKWTLTNPWAVVGLPPDATFPFDVDELSVYAQFTDGVGVFDLAVEVRRVMPDESRVAVVRSDPARLTFPGGNQILADEWVFLLTHVPLDEPGLYEFVAVAGDDELQGHTALVRVLDLEGGL
jgi:hypothetical protein